MGVSIVKEKEEEEEDGLFSTAVRSSPTLAESEWCLFTGFPFNGSPQGSETSPLTFRTDATEKKFKNEGFKVPHPKPEPLTLFQTRERLRCS